MNKFFKSLFTIGALAGLSYAGYKTYKRVNDVMKLSKTLPDYLYELLNEKPKIDINQKLNSLSITIGLSVETYENLQIDLEKQIDSFIAEYYPNIAKLRITITKYIKVSYTDKDEIEDDACDCENSCEDTN